MKTFFTNLKYKLQRFFRNLYMNAYGMDKLNKYLLYGALGLSIINIFIRNYIVNSLSSVLFILMIFRYFSRNKYKRSEENRLLEREIRYFKLKKENSKTHHIYKCKKCGQFIRVPKGVGKVETTCPNCKYKQTHRA